MKSFRARLARLNEDYLEIKESVEKAYKRSPGKQRYDRYATILHQTKIKSNQVLYESNWGRGVIDNPYAIFKQLVSDKAHSHLNHVWVISNPDDHAETIRRYSGNPNVRFVQRGSDEYMVALATSRYLFNNATFPPYFTKRKGQTYVNTWHGTPLKSMGYDLAQGNSENANVMRNFLSADYLLSANELMTSMYLESNRLRGIMPGAIIEDGYPRNDLFVSTDRGELRERLQACGVTLKEGKKTILYAPTWRQGVSSQTDADPEPLLNTKEKLENLLGTEDFQVLIKPHQYVYEILKNVESLRGLLVPSHIDANELLSITDVLISDYSSIFFDYLALRRPILFYITDAETYARDRGLSFGLDQLPGPWSDNIETLAQYILDPTRYEEEYGDKRNSMAKRITGKDDGLVCKRIIEGVIDGKLDKLSIIRDSYDKKRLLINGGRLLENGITRSLLSLLKLIDYDKWDVTVFVAPDSHDKEALRKVNEEIDSRARVLTRVGAFVQTSEEAIRGEFVARRGFYRNCWKKLYPDRVIENEYARCFGGAEFDSVVDFAGYSRFYTPLMLCGAAKHRAIWMHSDIKSDMNRVVHGLKPNYTTLHFVVSLYPEFDSIVACGESVMEVNRKKLAKPETKDKFTFARNSIDVIRFDASRTEDEVITLAGCEYYLPNLGAHAYQNVGCIPLPQADDTNFVTLGRLSTEKNHENLILAFGDYAKDHPRSKLYVLGDGPLREDLQELVSENNLVGKVVLAGRVGNPYAFMRRCDCFILPSKYEGLPLVILEARMCGLPIIVSNFDTVKDVLIPNGQLLIGFEREDIYSGLEAFEQGKVPTYSFDVHEYNERAYKEFEQAISWEGA